MPAVQKPNILHWTWHSRAKMNFYRLSEARVRRVMHSPKRVEEGIAEKTVAMMQPAGNGKHEIWVMFQDAGKKRKVISAWRYPGISKPRSEIAWNFLRREYLEYSAGEKKFKQEELGGKMRKSKWFRPEKKKSSGPANAINWK